MSVLHHAYTYRITMTAPGRSPADEATRYLCAAAHLDPEFADLLVTEFLTEPKRAVPPSPGIHSAPVLREALAAQANRRHLDATLLGLFAVAAIISFPAVALWLFSAVSWRVCAFFVTRLSIIEKGGQIRDLLTPRQQWWGTLILWSGFAMLWIWVPAIGLTAVARPASAGGDSILAILLFLSGLALLPGIYATLVAGHYLPWRTAITWFGFGAFHPDNSGRDSVRRACVRYEPRLSRFSAVESRRSYAGAGELTVYRGRNPFVGAGFRARSWSSAFQLRPKDSENWATDPVPPFTPDDLYSHISTRIEELRKAAHLSPGSRMAHLCSTRWATLAAGQLPYAASAQPLLIQLDHGQDPQLEATQWSELANNSPEWMRYYRCYRVEGWSNQLAVSGYLHIGCEERTLYLEWHGFVLPPVDTKFRTVDTPPEHLEWLSLRRALVDMALLPTTVPRRVSDLWRGLRAQGQSLDSTWSSPAQAAEVFGATLSIRELAAGRQMNNIFQELDSDRYLKILERSVLDAVHRFLDERKIQAKGFDEIVAQINNSTVINGSNVIAGNIGGESNTGAAGAAAPTKSQEANSV